ncbi:5401_t:CDS:1, partial [Ambispora gerdemannii]
MAEVTVKLSSFETENTGTSTSKTFSVHITERNRVDSVCTFQTTTEENKETFHVMKHENNNTTVK